MLSHPSTDLLGRQVIHRSARNSVNSGTASVNFRQSAPVSVPKIAREVLQLPIRQSERLGESWQLDDPTTDVCGCHFQSQDPPTLSWTCPHKLLTDPSSVRFGVVGGGVILGTAVGKRVGPATRQLPGHQSVHLQSLGRVHGRLAHLGPKQIRTQPQPFRELSRLPEVVNPGQACKVGASASARHTDEDLGCLVVSLGGHACEARVLDLLLGLI